MHNRPHFSFVLVCQGLWMFLELTRPTLINAMTSPTTLTKAWQGLQPNFDSQAKWCTFISSKFTRLDSMPLIRDFTCHCNKPDYIGWCHDQMNIPNETLIESVERVTDQLLISSFNSEWVKSTCPQWAFFQTEIVLVRAFAIYFPQSALSKMSSRTRPCLLPILSEYVLGQTAAICSMSGVSRWYGKLVSQQVIYDVRCGQEYF